MSLLVVLLRCRLLDVVAMDVDAVPDDSTVIADVGDN